MEGLSGMTTALGNANGDPDMGPSTASTAGTAAAKARPKGTRSKPAMLKLKDSCDMCAASKVRCDKRKPLCGRCKKLGYPCFFSPARRYCGRYRHREREPSIDTTSLQTATGASAHEKATGVRRSSTSVPSTTSTSISVSMLTSRPSAHAKGKGKAAANEQIHRRSLPSATPQMPTPADSSISTSTLSSYSSSMTDDASGSRTVLVSSSSPSLDSVPDSATNILSQSTGAGAAATPSDCATIASDTQLQLALARHRLTLQHSHPSAPAPDLAPRPAALETVAAAFRALSSVLVCPCSEMHTVGLLAGAVGLAMLDVYSAIISDSRAHHQDRHEQAPMTDGSCMLLSMEDEQLLFGGLSNSDSSSGHGARASPNEDEDEDGDATIVRVLGELARVARVVMQFSKRYEKEDEEEEHLPRSPGYLIALATLLRSHLQSVTMDAAI
ncbi:hypothetical protein L207DRAFT_593158 [Hyaloscypha variabilis F]|uniref:Zn(2)-C6 fungal-type domain-containing protein n=1 Tax=Hyaloscypha variabilis (strain UAMH 11265 / GT02V1 / F) TaxID=1149755 RepID=A0A2J6QUA8_HYAVF|nr:hypothetical protein L207DRAFT_593158 [Hyaloscypha variabilis F]